MERVKWRMTPAGEPNKSFALSAALNHLWQYCFPGTEDPVGSWLPDITSNPPDGTETLPPVPNLMWLPSPVRWGVKRLSSTSALRETIVRGRGGLFNVERSHLEFWIGRLTVLARQILFLCPDYGFITLYNEKTEEAVSLFMCYKHKTFTFRFLFFQTSCCPWISLSVSGSFNQFLWSFYVYEQQHDACFFCCMIVLK